MLNYLGCKILQLREVKYATLLIYFQSVLLNLPPKKGKVQSQTQLCELRTSDVSFPASFT